MRLLEQIRQLLLLKCMLYDVSGNKLQYATKERGLLMKKESNDPVLTQKHLTMLNDALRLNSEAMDLIGKCEACNLKVEKEKALLMEQQELVKSLKKQFFPKSK